jgi:hypothetical protein
LDGTLAFRNATWSHSQTPTEKPDPPEAQGANYGTATLFNVFGGPMLGATMQTGNFAFGASLSVPFGGRQHWDKEPAFANTPYPLAVDGEQRWHGIDAALTFIYLTAGAAYRIGPLAIGATGNLIFSSIQALQAKKRLLIVYGSVRRTKRSRAWVPWYSRGASTLLIRVRRSPTRSIFISPSPTSSAWVCAFEQARPSSSAYPGISPGGAS